MQRGLAQRVTALNRFIHDVYHEQGDPPRRASCRRAIFKNAAFRPDDGRGRPGQDVYAHIAGIDVVRAPDPAAAGMHYVLEDNLRVPSGVSHMLENRKMMMRLFPELFALCTAWPGGALPRPAAGDAARRWRRPA